MMFGDTTKPKPVTPFLCGSRIYLRAMEEDDLPCVRIWFNDPEIRRLVGEVAPMSAAGADQFLERIKADENRVWLTIVLKENERVIGEAGLLRIFYPWRTADLSIVIGDKFYWDKGYGREAILLLMDYAFGSLALHRLAIGVVGFNERALKFYERVGFKREGIQRDGYFSNHQFSDFVMMSILEDEFRALHRK
jgi:RimJ/RimL family protein N-acetyltransferase